MPIWALLHRHIIYAYRHKCLIGMNAHICIYAQMGIYAFKGINAYKGINA